jgi:hypothetical protein
MPGGKERTTPFDWLTVDDADSKAKAKEEAQKLAKQVHVHIASKVASTQSKGGESLREWSLRWVESRKAKGKDTNSDLNRLRPHIWPFLGERTMRDISRADVQSFVRHLDGLIHKKNWG